MKIIKVAKNNIGIRIDKFLAQEFFSLSRGEIIKNIKEGKILVNGEKIKPSYHLRENDEISSDISFKREETIPNEKIKLNIIYEDNNIIVVNKPAGIQVHPDSNEKEHTLVNALISKFPEIKDVHDESLGSYLRPGIVHRLDKDTSGLIVIAKNGQTLVYLQDQFRLRKVEKTYLALVDGIPPTRSGRIEASIGRDSAHRKQMAILPEGKGRAAVTEYKTLESFKKFTLLEVHPFTGRTHQIRLHLKLLGNPIVGDTIYGHKHPSVSIPRQFLHATRLKINLAPNDPPRVFEVPLPLDLEQVLMDVRKRDSK
jgi:23S rRNA pseudouridine1911/1915/1917 synthase